MAAGGIAGAAKTAALPLTDCRVSLLKDATLAVWPGVRRAGRSTAEPGADAGPAAPQAPRLIQYGLIRQRTALDNRAR